LPALGDSQDYSGATQDQSTPQAGMKRSEPTADRVEVLPRKVWLRNFLPFYEIPDSIGNIYIQKKASNYVDSLSSTLMKTDLPATMDNLFISLTAVPTSFSLASCVSTTRGTALPMRLPF
jgi:hypothetical protein